MNKRNVSVRHSRAQATRRQSSLAAADAAWLRRQLATLFTRSLEQRATEHLLRDCKACIAAGGYHAPADDLCWVGQSLMLASIEEFYRREQSLEARR